MTKAEARKQIERWTSEFLAHKKEQSESEKASEGSTGTPAN